MSICGFISDHNYSPHIGQMIERGMPIVYTDSIYVILLGIKARSKKSRKAVMNGTEKVECSLLYITILIGSNR
jgi:hypothetical protein